MIQDIRSVRRVPVLPIQVYRGRVKTLRIGQEFRPCIGRLESGIATNSRVEECLQRLVIRTAAMRVVSDGVVVDKGSVRSKPSQYVTGSGVFLLHVCQPVGLWDEIHVGNLFPMVVLVTDIG